jgi:hypothetical protein
MHERSNSPTHGFIASHPGSSLIREFGESAGRSSDHCNRHRDANHWQQAPDEHDRRAGCAVEEPVGQKIYNLGWTPKGPVKFTGGGSAVGNCACANRHGNPARGGTAPMISLSMLMYGGKMGNMPKAKYASTDAIFTTLTTGVRPDGSPFNANMPRYKLSRADFDQLAAFLLRQ